MKKILKAIGAALAKMATTTWRWVRKGGQWIYEALPAPAAAAASSAPQVEETREDIRGDEDQLACIRSAAACIAAGKVPDPSISGRIDSQHFRWLMACRDDMLKSIVRADNNGLRAHLQGRKNLRGVIPLDVAVIQEFEWEKMQTLGFTIDETGDYEYATPMAPA